MAATTRKGKLLELLRTELTKELDAVRQRAHDAAIAATHEENRPENDKDMRSTEASYVARGQVERAREIEQALARLSSITLRDLAPGDGIVASALVKIRHESTETTYFVVPAAGGVRLHDDGPESGEPGEVQTLATTSPLGAALLGLAEGDEAEVTTPHGRGQMTRIFEIVHVR